MKKTIEDVNVQGKKVLVRVDFNVPMDKETGTKITDENRIIGALPTIQYLLSHGAAVILCSHMGKPHNVLNAKLKLNKKELAKIADLPAEEQEAATEQALKKAEAKKPYSGESHPAEGAGNGYEILNCTSDGKERAVLDQILFLSASK